LNIDANGVIFPHLTRWRYIVADDPHEDCLSASLTKVVGTPMNRAPIPGNAKILVEVGSNRPSEMGYDPFAPFRMLWVITNGVVRRKFLWVTIRKTGIYVAHAGPDSLHTSYHTDGTVHWKLRKQKLSVGTRPALPNISEPILVQSASMAITDEVLDKFQLAKFEDQTADTVIYLDNRMLPGGLHYQVWAVPPFRHSEIPLMTDQPAHIHLVTHTCPWIEVVIYEQGTRRKA
jgi:hypothetical protein